MSALRSRQGASFQLLSRVGIDPQFGVNISIPLVLKYEDVAKRPASGITLSHVEIGAVIDYLCLVAHPRPIYFLWRPFLPDPKDNMLLELAVEAQCQYIVSFNKRDFANVAAFGLAVVNPQEFLHVLDQPL